MGFWHLNRKGISPLVALILLVSFSVALGVLVINLLSLLFVENPCESVEIELVELRDFKPLCVDYVGGRLIKFVLRNSGTVEIDHFKIGIITSEGISEGELKRSVKPTERMDVRDGFRFDSKGEIKEVTITPVVISENTDKVCVYKEVIFTDIPIC
ncbi:MAG TPA: hypothetical protein ENN46_03825 [Candidatus Woesearchaeota archaeon]|nr:hypothetical protein [Candidatus Woesearchaeota archaeon]